MVTRFGTSLISGFLVTATLLFFMQLLIASGRGAVVDAAPAQRFLDFIRVKPPVTPDIPVPETNKIIKPERQPPRDLPQGDEEVSAGIEISVPTVTPVFEIDPGGSGISSGELIPILKVAPIYPARPLSQGQECDVLVEYDVLATGATANPRVVNTSVCGAFQRSAIASVLKYRYKPRVVDGAAMAVLGVQTVIRYRIDPS